MSWKTGAFTTIGFRDWDNVLHSDVTMNKADGMIEKKSCSNCMLKSNPRALSWNKSSSPVVKGMMSRAWEVG